MIRLHAVGGFANRLQAILSWRAAHGAIEVAWDVNEYVSHAAPLEVLEPIAGVSFVLNASTWSVEDHGHCPTAPKDWRKAYAEVRPVEAIAKRVGKLVADLAPFAAMHVRRTDMVPLVARAGLSLTSDDDYGAWIDRWRPLMPVYLATDNGETQKKWIAHGNVHVGARLEGTEIQGEADHHRNGTLADAVVDLLTCARARYFLGAGFGSFSATIEILRGLP